MSFQATPAFQLGFQQAMAALEEEGMQVVLFPGTLRFKLKRDATLYVLAMVVRERAPRREMWAPEELHEFV